MTRLEEIKVRHVACWRVKPWSIRWFGQQIQVRSGKSHWNTRAHAIAAFKQHFERAGLMFHVMQEKTGVLHTTKYVRNKPVYTKEDLDAHVEEMIASGELQFWESKL